MDYLEIVLRGYFDDNNRKHLEGYFYRKFKEAEKEFFEPNEFFDGCLGIIKYFEAHIKHMFNDRRNELELLRNQAKNGLLQYKNMEGKTIEQKRQETIEYCETELTSLSENHFPIQLQKITNSRISGNLFKEDLLQIKLAIQNAFQKCENRAQPFQKIIVTEKKSESYQFFDNLLNSEMGELDILNAIEKMTSFDQAKLQALLYDIEFCLFVDKEETEAEISHEDIRKKIAELLEKNKGIPSIKFPEMKFKNGKMMPAMETPDLEAIFFPFKYFIVRRVIRFIKEKIGGAENSNSEKAQAPLQKNNTDYFNNSEGRLSVSDWAIIFYYLDVSGEQKGFKTKRFEKFITDNGIKTTPGYFKQVYHKICNRINLKENSNGKTLPPLPPERIEKILPLIKNNKKAKQRAENDIDYLAEEVRIYKEKYN